MSHRQKQLFDTTSAPWELDDARTVETAQVVFAQPPFGPFDYEVPDPLREQIQAGCRVRVPLGRGNRLAIGYCTLRQTVTAGANEFKAFKAIKASLDSSPLLSESMLRLAAWISEYYLCPLGVTIECMIPAGVRGHAGTRSMPFLSVATSVAARLTQLKLPPKQAQALRILAASPEPLTPQQLAAAAGCTLAPIQALQKKRLVRVETRRVGNLPSAKVAAQESAPELNDDQQQALHAVKNALRRPAPQTVLIHGVTGSGKTEVYIRAIEQVVQHGRQAIVLVPEISLTPQTQQRFRCRFPRVAVLHSRMTDVERSGQWRQIQAGQIDVVVGARSAIFAPTTRLGLIVLDEEHDGSFKQDVAPRYHARQVAQQRARLEQALLILGSATPSLESWHLAQQGTYVLVEMPRRVLNRPLPDVATIDMRTEFRQPFTRGVISRPLHQAIEQAVRDDGQVILLLNRRGFATSIQCPACGHTIRCQHCDIALTHHRAEERLLCHYCDYQTAVPTRCPNCQFDGIRFAGLGTQRLESEIGHRFPNVTCLRMDTDSMQKPGSHEQALDRFRRGEVQILLGTQMIAKGLDFPKVTLVGVVNADTALHLPDFRAAERTFQLVTQVAGRSGRGAVGGRVLVQTFSPEHPAIAASVGHDYQAFARQELPIRRQFGYPPFGAMIRIIVRGESASVTEQFADSAGRDLGQRIRSLELPIQLLGPAPAPMAKLRGKHRFHLLLLGEQVDQLRQLAQQTMTALKPPADVQWIADVDPLDML